MKPWLFISDLHLSPERTDIIDLFVRFCAEKASQAGRLYILGDFVEYWVGDDDPAQGLQTAFDALARLRDQGIELYFIVGNRDFLIGDALATRCGFELLSEPVMLDYAGTSTILMHGDSLCIDDTEYQAFRSMVRSEAWQQEFLSKSVEERLAIASAVRRQSAQHTSVKDERIMDVNQDSVEAIMRQNNANLLIHGHTHRPDIHHFQIDGQPATRIVLTDWYESGGYLSLDGNSEPALISYP